MRLFPLAVVLGFACITCHSVKASPPVKAQIAIHFSQSISRIEGLGGNFAQGYIGNLSTENDIIGTQCLKDLHPVIARIGLPMAVWRPTAKHTYHIEGAALGVMQLMQTMHSKHVPVILTIWNAPNWMVSNPNASNQRLLKPDKISSFEKAIVDFVVTARKDYNAPVKYLSFNEADGGYSLLFTPEQEGEMIAAISKKLSEHGLQVRWLAGDTSNGSTVAQYASSVLQQVNALPYLGPIAFHSWGGLQAPLAQYKAIAAMHSEYHRPIWCTEVGVDPSAWKDNPPVWPSWKYAFQLAEIYYRVFVIAHASVACYWEYQNDYPLMSSAGEKYPSFVIIKELSSNLTHGSRLVKSSSTDSSLLVMATRNTVKNSWMVEVINTGGNEVVTVSGLHGIIEQSKVLTQAGNVKDSNPDAVMKSFNLSLPADSVAFLSGKLHK